MKSLAPLREAAADPYAYARAWKAARGRPVVGYFCSYTPEEIIWAAGALPMRVFGSGARVTLADAHLQAYSCSLVRGALEDGLAGQLGFLDGMVFPHTCDSIQRLSDIWRMNLGTGFHLDAVLPVKLDTPSAREYLAAVLEKFRRELGGHLDREVGPAALASAVADYAHLREGMANLYALRRERPGALSSRDLHTVTRAAMVMDRREMGAHLETVLAEAREAVEKPVLPLKRLVLSGGLCSMPDLYGIIEEAGAWVVDDDLCTGSRFFEGRVAVTADPLQGLARRYAERAVCPAKHRDLRGRGLGLVERVRRAGAHGVIFLLLKFCDPHAFDYPYMKGLLEEAGIPSLLLEVEDRLPAEGQFRTRCEAFVEGL
jgi:bcr-type benzoyl-CoA reductase subunit C